jgi:hypothetical protein
MENNQKMKLVILNYNDCSLLIKNVNGVNLEDDVFDWKEYIVNVLSLNLDEIHWMVCDNLEITFE